MDWRGDEAGIREGTIRGVKITLLTYGSRGDVQPFAALARELMQRGHQVRLAAPHRFAELVEGSSIPFVPLAGDPEEISRRMNASGSNVLRMVRGMRDYILSIAGEVARGAFGACEGAGLIVHSFLFTVGAHSLARQMGIPDISAQLFPMFYPTKEFPNVALPQVPRGALSWFTHWLANRIFWYGGSSGFTRLRREYPGALPRKLYWPFKDSAGRRRTPMLGAWSPGVLPRPQDWPEQAVEITGYWFLDPPEDYQPPAELADFLAAGERPVCISFGSMIHPGARSLTDEVMEALTTTGRRAVILTGWQDWEVKPREEVLFLPGAPHAWLFPRCRAVVHHGGAGTTGAGLRSGVPNIILPFTGDQFFWAQRLHELGLMRKPLRVERLTAGWLAAALEETEAREMRERARQLGAQIERERGVEQAAAFIERWAAEKL